VFFSVVLWLFSRTSAGGEEEKDGELERERKIRSTASAAAPLPLGKERKRGKGQGGRGSGPKNGKTRNTSLSTGERIVMKSAV